MNSSSTQQVSPNLAATGRKGEEAAVVRHRQGEHTAYQSEPAALAGGSSRTCTDLLKEAEARRSFHDPIAESAVIT